jgi:hypothetical protein
MTRTQGNLAAHGYRVKGSAAVHTWDEVDHPLVVLRVEGPLPSPESYQVEPICRLSRTNAHDPGAYLLQCQCEIITAP